MDSVHRVILVAKLLYFTGIIDDAFKLQFPDQLPVRVLFVVYQRGARLYVVLERLIGFLL